MSARLDLMATTKPLITVVMDDEQVKRLDDWRFANHFDSRGAAIRWMIDECLRLNMVAPEEATRSARHRKAK